MGLFATGPAVLTTVYQVQYQSPKARRNDSASPSGGNAAESDLVRDLGVRAADTPDDLDTVDDGDFADDDTWIE
jgi:hypothetical protein